MIKALISQSADIQKVLAFEGAFEKHKPGGGKVVGREVSGHEAPVRATPSARVKTVLNRGEEASATRALRRGAAGT